MRIRQLRTKQRMSQETLAQASGLSKRYVGMIERGIGNVSLESLEKITTALDVMLKISFEQMPPSES
ncbi:helix-turn-helix domain-containing protein [Ferroacidibacillus organovorans]|uniref:HTH cro/C1-type domain-containing protein n=1 Tax=Ferroacidibacillus organovorans TaxID=1765683 RepID=A0A853KA81_9BACL|nr:helix-turn-helix domain-containing protein [Ferroacidibacillus organovorans]KYP81760.1 hypothetical protein AYJ22_05865 [Ferroacidibacillus organovorans]OAG93308.1 hypothetical protein AYW79_11380 [Ferroacidibacillus organovorans]